MSLVSNIVSNVVGSAAGAVGGLANGLAGSVSGALGGLAGAAGGLMSALRSKNIPLGAEGFIPKEVTTAQMGADNDDDSDWRVRLSFPSSVATFQSSPLFKPLRDAGGLIFPYTPTISISSTANYTETPITHHNFQFVSYANSRVNEISISADFYVEDAVQAQYWLSCVHFLRSVTKMFTGEGGLSGNPPVILYFNAYGDYVFKDIPVVVKNFSMTLPKEVDYITTNMINPKLGSSGGFQDPTASLADTAGQLAGVASAFGATKAANALRTVSNVSNLVGSLSSVAAKTQPGANSSSVKSGTDDSHVPTQSTLSISLLPIYSRNRIRKFTLEDFVNGKYVKDGFI
jgi:hypothetical protein